NAGWSTLGSGVDGDVWALAVSGSDLYVGGFFSTAGGTAANGIAKWTLGGGGDANSSALGSGDGRGGGGVEALAVAGSDLYVGGDFSTAGGVVANNIAKWAIGSGTSDFVDAMASNWEMVGSSSACNDDAGWSPLGSGVDGRVMALAVA